MTIISRINPSFLGLASLSACLLLLLAACTPEPADDSGETGETGETGEDESLEPGSYTDDFGDTHTITAAQWQNSSGSFAIIQWYEDEQWLLAQNGPDNMYFPELWSRFDWTWDGDQLYYCQIVFDGATSDDAVAGSSDANDLLMGCNGFAWTMLNPA
jgi:hypothetical protein